MRGELSMTVVVHSTTKNATGAIKYARDGIDKKTGERKCVAMSAFQADMSNAEFQFSAVRKAYGKEKGVQAQIFIQSFENGINPEKANRIGLETVKRFNERVKGTYQAVIYTHGNTDSPHNHIVINSVDPETGLKYHVKRDLELFREVSDEVSLENGVMKLYPSNQKVKETFAEKKLREQGEYVWKDDLRNRIDEIAPKSTSFNDFKEKLHEEQAIEVIQRGSQFTFSFVDETGLARKARSKRLGADYEPDHLESVFGTQMPEIVQEVPQTTVQDSLIRYVSEKLKDYDLSYYYYLQAWSDEFENLSEIDSVKDLNEVLEIDFYATHSNEIERDIDEFEEGLIDFDFRAQVNYDLDRYASMSVRRNSTKLLEKVQHGEFNIPERGTTEYSSETQEMTRRHQFMRSRGYDFEM